MNYAVLLCGGTGTRLGSNIPKQYLKVNDRMIFSYALEAMQNHKLIDRIVIVADSEWYSEISEELKRFSIDKFYCFAESGESRQHSVLNGMRKIAKTAEGVSDDDKVLIHDAARPNLTKKIIDDCFDFENFEATLPVVNVTDTTYFSQDGKHIDQLLDRDKLFAGQTPETFFLNRFLEINENMTDEQLSAVRGCCQAAYQAGVRVKLFMGDFNNFKITTIQDYERFRIQKEQQ